jgi:hypothetical protein
MIAGYGALAPIICMPIYIAAGRFYHGSGVRHPGHGPTREGPCHDQGSLGFRVVLRDLICIRAERCMSGTDT